MELALEVAGHEQVRIERERDGVPWMGVGDSVRARHRVDRRMQDGVAARRRTFVRTARRNQAEVAILEPAEHRVRAGNPHFVAHAHAQVAAVARDQRQLIEVAADLLHLLEHSLRRLRHLLTAASGRFNH